MRSIREMTEEAMNISAGWKSCLFGLKYVTCRHLPGKTPPLIRGVVLTNRCNLQCRHCRLADRDPSDLNFAEATAAIDVFHREGGRCLYLEGGEPLLWHDGSKGLDDLVRYAHGRGFLTVVVYTNGTLPIRTCADTVFVSVDGLRDTHDALRGKSFDRVMRNIQDSTHPSLYINFTINNRNKDEIRAFCEYVQDLSESVRGIFFYFHTPYYGYDELFIEPLAKQPVLRELLELRKQYRILNSRAGLQSALRDNWERPLNVCSVYEKGTVYECCRFRGDPKLCRDCGYLNYPEIDQALKLKPSALLNAVKYF